jgi:hypothetical protein
MGCIRLLQTVSGRFKPFRLFIDHFSLFWTVLDRLEPFWLVSYCSSLVCFLFGLIWTISGRVRLLQIVLDSFGMFWAVLVRFGL